MRDESPNLFYTFTDISRYSHTLIGCLCVYILFAHQFYTPFYCRLHILDVFNTY